MLPVGSVAVVVSAALFVGGVGLGATLSGTIHNLAPAASAAERAGLLAAIYLGRTSPSASR